MNTTLSLERYAPWEEFFKFKGETVTLRFYEQDNIVYMKVCDDQERVGKFIFNTQTGYEYVSGYLEKRPEYEIIPWLGFET